MNNKQYYYTWSELKNIKGIKNFYQLRKFINRGEIEKIDNNLYTFSNELILKNNFYTLQHNKEFLYSHFTAAYLHNLTMRDPVEWSIIVKQGTNVSNIKRAFLKEGIDNLKVYYISEDEYNCAKTKLYWGDSYIYVTSAPYTVYLIVKNYKKSYDKWVSLEILSKDLDYNENLVLNKLLSKSKKLKDQYNITKESLKW